MSLYSNGVLSLWGREFRLSGFIYTLFFTSIMLNSAQVSAANPTLIIQDGKWSAYEMKDGSNKICYMVSTPAREEGNYSKRGKVYAMVTHRPAEKSFNVVSFHAGYGFSPGAMVDVLVGKDKFRLFTESEAAWAANDMDGAIVDAILKGNDIVVTGQSAKGTATKDTYSLKGSSRAYKAMSKACGVQ